MNRSTALRLVLNQVGTVSSELRQAVGICRELLAEIEEDEDFEEEEYGEEDEDEEDIEDVQSPKLRGADAIIAVVNQLPPEQKAQVLAEIKRLTLDRNIGRKVTNVDERVGVIAGESENGAEWIVDIDGRRVYWRKDWSTVTKDV